VVTADAARQGALGKRVLVVLISSLIGALLAWFIVTMMWTRAA
jgi:hypothetical protein